MDVSINNYLNICKKKKLTNFTYLVLSKLILNFANVNSVKDKPNEKRSLNEQEKR